MHPVTQLNFSTRVIKRAQYEALEFSIHPEARGVLVRNESHADPENHEYHVTVLNGVPSNCECPANAKYSGACKHRVGVAIQPMILEVLARCKPDPLGLIADGGTPQPESTDPSPEVTTGEACEDECACADLPGEFPCWECYRSGHREFPDDDREARRTQT
ncbi:SWIM zinc finger family protein [Halobacterium wangiae]|uniref:SWIM zinc finger family protein n=1 Tax=Halobacterium wangiae TaxID=2902623 RepID=UPI001E616F31|nr:SWIM zinc finger family protein [Halobacterium wangiae]